MILKTASEITHLLFKHQSINLLLSVGARGGGHNCMGQGNGIVMRTIEYLITRSQVKFNHMEFLLLR
jgi:hypothetical protein